MTKIRVLALAAAFGLMTLVGCNPTASTALDKAKEVAKETGDKVKEGADKAVDKTKEVAGDIKDKAKEGMEKMKEGFNKLKETFDKDLAVIGDKLKELGKKKEEKGLGAGEVKALNEKFTESNGILEKIKEAMKGFNLESLKDGTALEAIKAKIEPLIAELKKKLDIK